MENGSVRIDWPRLEGASNSPFRIGHRNSRIRPAPSVVYHILCISALLASFCQSDDLHFRRDKTDICRTSHSMASEIERESNVSGEFS